MQNERQRILKLVENGTISAEEAIVLLEGLGKDEPVQATMPVAPKVEEQQEKSDDYNKTTDSAKNKSTGFEDLFNKAFNDKEANKKMNEFMNDLKEDLSQFSNRMMGLMNGAFSKVKEFDFEFPFGEKVEFNKTYVYDAEEVKGFEVDLPSGKLTIEKAADDKILVEANVKVVKSDNDEEQTIAKFTNDFVTLRDGKLTIATAVKMSSVDLRVYVPEKNYDIFIVRLLNGGVTASNIQSTLLKLKTYNGALRIENVQFQRADLNSGNGMIEARLVKGEDLEAESVNGRIYIDGDIQEIEAESVNGAVTLTTASEHARKLKGSTVAGTVELYVPKNVALDGRVTTNFGKTDVGLQDVAVSTSEDQFLLKTAHFSKAVEGAPVLKLIGETRTGSVIVRYHNN
ncbi:DUF4097 family beta strand repeat-containing protein [Lysinibacillus louembei]|uniref:DUF4097 family beta strand repeat-containing protein n=1 Tax=Lysinibacillus louembei TaxID=1470088 RepID=A0ABZ0RYK8_9BACI|nr:DUF4097 family beta strand repeat-containing protein [Lysinibacillus louembei]WPK12367.1 DUF4097 family beta strand repeat-containing protein [Lysinibacillus louembei]